MASFYLITSPERFGLVIKAACIRADQYIGACLQAVSSRNQEKYFLCETCNVAINRKAIALIQLFKVDGNAAATHAQRRRAWLAVLVEKMAQRHRRHGQLPYAGRGASRRGEMSLVAGSSEATRRGWRRLTTPSGQSRRVRRHGSG